MRTILLELENEVFEETERIALNLNISRNQYINEAIEANNTLMSRKLLKEKLVKESNQVNKTSMEVLAQLKKITDKEI